MRPFELEFETRIRQLKSEFLAWRRALWHAAQDQANGAAEARARSLRQRHETHVTELRAMVRDNFDQFDAHRVSSILALPSRMLDDEERILHRIWMGSNPPEVVRHAMVQWNSALTQVADNAAPYRQMLWIWDESQMHGDACFAKNIGIGCGGIGRYTVGATEIEVYSLRNLALECLASIFPLLEALQVKRYFVNLSDLFRLVILREFGGIYLDADTIPYRSAPVLLAKPEVPDYKQPSGDDVSWLNLYRDENGVLIAARNDEALRNMVTSIASRLANLPRNMPSMRATCVEARAYAALLQEATYGVWEQQIGRSFLAYADIAESYCILHDGAREHVVAGLEGMRLVKDALTSMPIPLSVHEQRCFDRSVTELEMRNWRLYDALELERIADIVHLHEHPRMAYPPQLRSRIANCAYYSFLSHDDRLDRVNALFGEYLVAQNGERVGKDGFWRATRGSSASQVRATVRGFHDMLTFLPGETLPDEYKDRMAKLLFGTSYLEYCSFGNKLNLSFVELQRRQNIDPYLSLAQGMINDAADFTDFVGFFIAGTAEEFQALQAVSYYRDDMRAMDEAYDAFVARYAQEGDLFVSSLAIDEPWRGKGMFNAMFREIELQARSKDARRIVLTTWENKSSALQIYLKKGFKAEGTFEFARNLFFDRLHFLSYELEPALTHEAEY